MRRLHLTWQSLRTVGKSKLIRLTILIPVLGYMLLFNEQLVELFELSKEIFNVTSSANEKNHISVDNKTRLFFFYFGFTFLGVGSLLYQIFCPGLIKENESKNEYMHKHVVLMTERRFMRITKHLIHHADESHFPELNDLKKQYAISEQLNYESGVNERAGLSTDLMHIQWEYENNTRHVIRRSIFIFYSLGFITLFIPTIDMFVKVLHAFFS